MDRPHQNLKHKCQSHFGLLNFTRNIRNKLSIRIDRQRCYGSSTLRDADSVADSDSDPIPVVGS